MQTIYENELNTEYDISNDYKVACWFDTIEIRTSEGYDKTSNIIIKHDDGQKITIFGEETGFYYQESAFTKLSPNGEYLIVDQGTGKIRGVSIISTRDGSIAAEGTYIHKIRYDGSQDISFLRYDKYITSNKQVAVEYIQEKSVRDLEGNSLENDVFRKRVEEAPEYASFLFGTLYRFNLSTGKKDMGDYVLFYIDIQ